MSGCGCGQAETRSLELGLAPEALARSALRLRRAREALDAVAAEFLAANAAMSAAGYILIQRNRLAEAPAEIALRALSSSISAIGGMSEPVRLAKLEALLASLQADPSKTRTLGGCMLSSIGGRLGVFRELRGCGLPALKLAPGERALWDNRFRVELGRLEAEPVTIRALGPSGWRHLGASSPFRISHPRHAGLTLPSCWRGDEMLFLPKFDDASEDASEGGFRARFVGGATFCGGRQELKEASTSLG